MNTMITIEIEIFESAVNLVNQNNPTFQPTTSTIFMQAVEVLKNYYWTIETATDFNLSFSNKTYLCLHISRTHGRID